MCSSFSSLSHTSSLNSLPSLRCKTRSAYTLRWRSCVTITIVIPRRRLRSIRMLITRSLFRVSRSPVGSSRSRMSGAFTKDLAIVTLCCSPPDSSEGTCPRRPPIPTASRSWVARFRLSAAEREPCRAKGSSTFSSAVSCEIRLKVWNTNPSLFRRIAARSESGVWSHILVPHTLTLPFVGLSMVPMMLSNVLLPPPEVPNSITNSPRRTRVETPRNAATPSMPSRYVLWTFSMTIISSSSFPP
mmetsp:Transcript_18025/g.41712  ORF Transcript_18025/g.41712 Transcript_18025/m.41712 type:complete len:244 (-) Transcript_18025:181-912(-)